MRRSVLMYWAIILAALCVAPPAGRAGTNADFTTSIATPTVAWNPAVGQTIEIEIEIQGAVEATGGVVTARYDTAVVAYREFIVGALIPNLFTLPASPKPQADGTALIEAGGGQLTGAPGAGAGSFGTLVFEVVGTVPTEESFISIIEVLVLVSPDDQDALSFAPGEFGVEVKSGGVPGDYTGDGTVDFNDFFLLADAFGHENAQIDLNGDGFVDFTDFFILAENFGKSADEIVAENTVPRADAGADRTVGVGAIVTLDGSASSDADGDVLTYAWTPVDETTASLSDPTAVQPTFRPTAAGVYVFALVVGDGTVESAADEVVITALAPPPGTGLPPAPPVVVVFADPDLEAAVREVMGKTEGLILGGEAVGLNELNAADRGIRQLDGLEHFTGLTELNLNGNAIASLASLSDLERLQILRCDRCQISDIAALENLSDLRLLSLNFNQIGDIAALEPLTELRQLSLIDNAIDDIGALAELEQLRELSLVDNQVDDIAALAALPELSLVSLFGNQIVDVAALVANEGLGPEDTVNLRNNPLSTEAFSTQIPALQARGVSVDFDDPAILIADANLEAALREALNKAAGDIVGSDARSLTQLVATDRDIRQLDGLEHFTNLTELDLTLNQIADVSALAQLTELTTLRLGRNQIADLSPLASLTGLSRLEIFTNPIEALSPLSGLIGLSVLDLRNSGITDVRPLAGLTGLDWLLLTGNQIADISPLAGLAGLGQLELLNNQIEDVSALSSLVNLTSIDVRFNRIADISPLVNNTGLGNGDQIFLQGNSLSAAALTQQIPTLQARGATVEFDNPAIVFADANLEAALRDALNKATGDILSSDAAELTRLDASDRTIASIAGLEHFTSLTSLTLDRNQISDILPLSALSNLNRLIIRSNPLSDIAPLAGLTQLKLLWLDGNQISDISALSELTQLEGHLGLGANQIRTISALSDLTRVTSLGLNANQIDDIGPLSGLTQLITLQIQNNQISTISAVSGMTQLTFLGLNDNRFSDLSPLAGLTQLEGLWLSDNQLSDISALSNLTRLDMLWLQNNQISDVSALAGMTLLEELRLDTNQLEDIAPLVTNSGLGAGDAVDLRNNPLGTEAHSVHIPALQERGAAIQF